ncbi:flagellar biosynthesis protein FlhF [Halorhodospira halochloris]|uniref:Flagellar biosynthesis protein FlhF n=1 Tax=Halorhodospira halochloris TaxID=1052 RepID=A0A0X8XBI3_HALHR|nr:flagellar biosynthesis protein FlhF [Halorhodospira halochloris]MBK1651831.1 flagellar biosynthesis protein FlhF [Halorhodospira halochloris]BAU58834.1 flagellar biosynthesis protein FlhF [Halorhodospira halochloris]
MRIKRIFAANTREALRKVKEQHGPDAVVLSSRSIDGGVEVISAIDYDEQAVQAAARAQDPRANEIPPLEGSPGPRPGEPDRAAADDQAHASRTGGYSSYGATPAMPNDASQAADTGRDSGVDDASRARQAALARLRRLRADGVADNALPDVFGQGEADRSQPQDNQVGLSRQQEPVAAQQHHQPAPDLRSAADGAKAETGKVAAPRRFSADDLAGSDSGRLNLRVGDDDDDAELFAALSREHSEREKQRAQAPQAKQRAKPNAPSGRQERNQHSTSARRHKPSVEQPESAYFSGRDSAAQNRRSGSSHEAELRQMREEISALRDLFESQLSLLEWGRMGRRHPARAGVIKRLADLGLGSDISKRLADHIGSDEDPNSAFRKALALVARHLPIAGDEIVNRGGVVALVGPTGVGKTTTVAKLAARYALRHGRDKVALVSTDNYRVGAQDQLLTYARILDVPVYTATNKHELRNVVDDLAGRGLVLIDTVGMSQRDVRLAEQFKTLGSAEGLVRTYLVLSAATQLSTLTDSVSAFTGASPVGCILTKVDEATTLGGALTCALRTRLPLAYLATGQRVPEDIQAARGDTLVHRACVLLDEHKQELDEDALALSLGGGANAPE